MTPPLFRKAAEQDEGRNNYVSGQGQEIAATHLTTMVILNPPMNEGLGPHVFI